MSDITLLTESRYLNLDMSHWYHQQIALEEGLLIDALEALGLRTDRQAWDDPFVDWRATDTLVFRSTWNYFDCIDRFRPWLDTVSTHTRCINDAALVQWNMDKHYLADLSARGVPVVPTVFVEAGSHGSLSGILGDTGWDEVVIKPAVGGAARLTWRANRATAESEAPVLQDCLRRESMLIQPFQRAIEHSGEVSVIVIGGAVTHGVRKQPRTGDFRVQDDHGGTVHPHDPTRSEIELALQAVAACPQSPCYARVDMVSSDEGPRLMEIELIEPELFLRHRPTSATALARAIASARG